MTQPPLPLGDDIRGGTPSQPGEGPALFISDLHLSPERPGPVRLFQAFMRDVAPGAGQLYILGDFFEAWVGDDDLGAPFNREILASIAGLAGRGVAIRFLPGNRDFLVGSAFARAAGLDLLADPVRIDLFGTPTLLSHGDLFCTDDDAYQTFRRQVREAAWQADFLARPIEERRAMARALRERSEQAKAGKKPDIMDVNPDAVLAGIREWDVRRVIHGHTHRPARHEIPLTEGTVERWVLPDWYETGGYLRCDRTGCRLVSLP